MKKLVIVLLLTLSIYMTTAGAQSEYQIVVNSADWVDVYSAIMYANHEGIPYHFVIGEAHGQVLPQYMDKTLDIRLIKSNNVPYISGYKTTLEKEGYTVTDETGSSGGRKLNLELAGELDINKFIVVDDIYGYNAISAASYAVRSKSWVLFADRDNIDEVYTFLSSRNVESVLIYGRVDKAVKEQLSGFNPEIINEGNRFDNNLAIVTKYMEIAPAESVILTNGDFIESTIMSGESPVIFIGTDIVPPQVVDYVKNSTIRSGTIIGNDLTNSAKRLKDASNISVFIKFGQGRQTTGGFNLVEELDRFYLPGYELTLDAVSAQYNEAAKQLEVIFRNDARIGEFVKASVGIFVGEERIATVGDDEARYIEAESESGRAYDVDLTDYARNSNIRAEVSAVFGEDSGSLNLLFTKSMDVSIVSLTDNSEMDVYDPVYYKVTQRIKLTLENTGNVPGYASPSVVMLIDGEKETIRFGNAIPLAPGEKKEVSSRVDLTDPDLADNPEVQVRIDYGERSSLLIKNKVKVLPLKVDSGITTVLIAIAALIALVILAIFIWNRRKTSVKSINCTNCGATLTKDVKFCPKCGSGVESQDLER